MQSARVYIGHLPYKVRESDIEGFFSRYGRIREILLKNGFGFVEFDDPRDAEDAVYRCNGKELRGERIIVEMTKRPPKGRDMYGSGRGGGRFNSGYGGGRPSYNNRSPPRRRDEYIPSQTRHRLVVENLSTGISWQDLKDVMRAAGEVTYADAHRIRRNEGVVCFSCAADLKKALDTLDGKELNGRKIKLIDASRASRQSRSHSRSRSKSSSRSRSRSSRRSRSRSGSGSASSKSKSRSRSRSAEKSSKNKIADKSDNNERSRSNSRDESRSTSPDDKRRSGSRSATPDDANGRKSDIDD